MTKNNYLRSIYITASKRCTSFYHNIERLRCENPSSNEKKNKKKTQN